jgi:hypothetical protein
MPSLILGAAAITVRLPKEVIAASPPTHLVVVVLDLDLNLHRSLYSSLPVLDSTTG